MSPAQFPADVPQGSSRHSTFRRRASFALPVVLVAAVGAGCDHERTTTKPPYPGTTTDVLGESSPPSTPVDLPGGQITSTTVTTGAPTPAPASTGVVNPPPPAPAPPDSIVLTNPPATSTTVMVITNPPPPDTSTTWIRSVNPPPP